MPQMFVDASLAFCVYCRYQVIQLRFRDVLGRVEHRIIIQMAA